MDQHFPASRRAIVAGIAALLGTAALPPAAIAASGEAGAPRTLPPSQFTLLEAVADTIMPASDTPGALAAQVPARLDGLLRDWASPPTREAIVGALARIDSAALTQKGKGFVALSPSERMTMLTAHDADALKSANPALKSVADPGYLRLKELVIALYYYSETAATSELIYEHVPGKYEPSLKVTAQTRPYLGTWQN
jgi:gluconate 2-dehydrogenase gamma chain